MKYEEFTIEGRNAVLEAFRSGKTIDKVLILKGCQDGPVLSIAREARKHDTLIQYVPKERLASLSRTGKHQGVIAYAAAYAYASVEDMFALAEERGEPPFFFLLDGIEDPHNLGAIIRTANLAGAHGVIIPKRRAVGTDGCGGEGVGRSAELHAGGQSGQPDGCHGGTEKKGNVVCLRGHGRNPYV